MRCDLPGVDPCSVAIAVVDRVLTVRAERRGHECDGDEALELECSRGLVARDVLLGEDLDAERLEHDYRDGVLVVQMPVVTQRAVTGSDA